MRHELRAPDGILDLLEYKTHLGEEIGARRCKPGKTMSYPPKQADAHLLFERGYLFSERRLRDLKSIGGSTEIQLLGHDHEISEVPKLNISMTNIIGQAGAARRTWFSRNSHLCHCQLNRCTPERKAAVRCEFAISLHSILSRCAVHCAGIL